MGSSAAQEMGSSLSDYLSKQLTSIELDAALADALGWTFYLERRGSYNLAVRVLPGSDVLKGQKVVDREKEMERYQKVSAIEAQKAGFYGRGIPRFSRDWELCGELIVKHKVGLKFLKMKPPVFQACCAGGDHSAFAEDPKVAVARAVLKHLQSKDGGESFDMPMALRKWDD